jgi:hypothetical protein
MVNLLTGDVTWATLTTFAPKGAILKVRIDEDIG